MGCVINFKFPSSYAGDRYLRLETDLTEDLFMGQAQNGSIDTLGKIAELFCGLSNDDVLKQDLILAIQSALVGTLSIDEFLTDRVKEELYVPNRSGQDLITAYPTLFKGLLAEDIGNVLLINANSRFRIKDADHYGLLQVIVHKQPGRNEDFFIVPENYIGQFARFARLRKAVRLLKKTASLKGAALKTFLGNDATVQKFLEIQKDLVEVVNSFNLKECELNSQYAAIDQILKRIEDLMDSSGKGKAGRTALAYLLAKHTDADALAKMIRICLDHFKHQTDTQLAIETATQALQTPNLTDKLKLDLQEKIRQGNQRLEKQIDLKLKKLNEIATVLAARKAEATELYKQCYLEMAAYETIWNSDNERAEAYTAETREYIRNSLILKQKVLWDTLTNPFIETNLYDALLGEAFQQGYSNPEELSLLRESFSIADNPNNITIYDNKDGSPLDIADDILRRRLNSYHLIIDNIASIANSNLDLDNEADVEKAVDFLDEYIHNSAAMDTALTRKQLTLLGRICDSLQWDSVYNTTGNPLVDSINYVIKNRKKESFISYADVCLLLRDAHLLDKLEQGKEQTPQGILLVTSQFKEHFLKLQSRYDSDFLSFDGNVFILKLDATIVAKALNVSQSEESRGLIAGIRRLFLLVPYDSSETPGGKYEDHYVYQVHVPYHGTIVARWVFSKERLNKYDFRQLFNSPQELYNKIHEEYTKQRISIANNLFLLPKEEFEEDPQNLKDAQAMFEQSSHYAGLILTEDAGVYSHPKTYVCPLDHKTYYYSEEAYEFKSKFVPRRHGSVKPGTIFETVKAFDANGKRIVRGTRKIPIEMTHAMFDSWVNSTFNHKLATLILSSLKTTEQKALWLTHAFYPVKLLESSFKDMMTTMATQIGLGTTEYYVAYTDGVWIGDKLFAKFNVLDSLHFSEKEEVPARVFSGESWLNLKAIQLVFATHGIHVEIVNTELAKEITGTNITAKGFMRGGIIYLNKDNITANTPFHEFTHLFLGIVKAKGVSSFGNSYEDLIQAFAERAKLIDTSTGQVNTQHPDFKKKAAAYVDVIAQGKMSLQEATNLILEELFAEAYGDYLADSLNSPFSLIFADVDSSVINSSIVTDKTIELPKVEKGTSAFFQVLSSEIREMRNRQGFNFFALSDDAVSDALDTVFLNTDQTQYIHGTSSIQELEEAKNKPGLYLNCP